MNILIIAGIILLVLVFGGLAVIYSVNPKATEQFWTPASEACKLEDGTTNEACLKYYPEIIRNTTAVMIMTIAGGVVAIGLGIRFEIKYGESKPRPTPKRDLPKWGP